MVCWHPRVAEIGCALVPTNCSTMCGGGELVNDVQRAAACIADVGQQPVHFFEAHVTHWTYGAAVSRVQGLAQLQGGLLGACGDRRMCSEDVRRK